MKRGQFSSKFKKRIVIEAIREHRTVNEIANEHQLHPVQITKWKKELLDGAISIFEDRSIIYGQIFHSLILASSTHNS